VDLVVSAAVVAAVDKVIADPTVVAVDARLRVINARTSNLVRSLRQVQTILLRSLSMTPMRHPMFLLAYHLTVQVPIVEVVRVVDLALDVINNID
jgi:hypothetical protein